MLAESALDSKPRHGLRSSSTRRISLQHPNTTVTHSLALPSCNSPSVALLPIQSLSRWPPFDTHLQESPFDTSVAELWTSTHPVHIKGTTTIQPSSELHKDRPSSEKPKQKAQKPPMLRPSLKSSRCKSAPSTPVANKSVHFDFPLEHISLFTPSTYDRCKSEDEDEMSSEMNISPIDKYSGSNCNSNNNHRLDYSPVLFLPNWPNDSSVRFFTQMVSLESIVFCAASQSLKGTIQVQNIAFQKIVTVRYTTNHWTSWTDVIATYKEPVGDNHTNSALDRFVFTIDMDPMANLLITQVFMAVQYQAREREFWDNNSGRNFLVLWRRSSNSTGNKHILARPSRHRTHTVGDMGIKTSMDPFPMLSFYESYSIEQALSHDDLVRTNLLLTGEKSVLIVP